jgi:hypothetical protein
MANTLVAITDGIDRTAEVKGHKLFSKIPTAAGSCGGPH